MPYKIKGKCIYKKNGGKKVGCTKGDVKKYLAALEVNVDESKDFKLNEIRKFIRSIFLESIKCQKINLNESSNFNLDDYKKWKRKNITIRGVSNGVGEHNDAGARFGEGLYTAALSNKSMAKGYGKVYYVLNGRPKNPVSFKNVNVAETWLYRNVYLKNHKNVREFNASTNLKDELLNMGYDGLEIKGREMVNYTPEDVKYFENEAQLMNYYDDFVKDNNIQEDLKNDKIIFLRNKNNSNEYVYHGTSKGAAYKMKREGVMKPGQASGSPKSPIFFSNTEQYALTYASRKDSGGGLLLRVKKTPDMKISDRVSNEGGYVEYYTFREIPISEVEVKTSTRWKPIGEYEFINENRNNSDDKYVNCHASDLIRMDMIEDFFKSVEENSEYNIEEPDYDMLLDPYDGYGQQTYIQNDLAHGRVIFREGWSSLCWEGLYAKPEYKGLTKEQAIKKIFKERIPRIAKEFNMTVEKADYFFHVTSDELTEDGYIMKIVFKKTNSELNEVRGGKPSEITIYHGTSLKKIDGIKQKGLQAGNLGYQSAGWYMVSTDFESALFHAVAEEGEKAPVVEFKIPVDNSKWEGYPYFWPPYERNEKSKWFALKQPLPEKFITKIHYVNYDKFVKQKGDGLNEQSEKLQKNENVKLVPADINFAKEHWGELFPGGDSSFNNILTYVDKKISKSIMFNNKIVGVYLLGTTTLPEVLEYYDDEFYKKGFTYKLEKNIDIKKYDNKKGIHGIFLYILPEYRNKKIGKLLMEYSESLGDYVWGQHAPKLNNLENWLKRRKLIGKNYKDNKFDGYITSTL